MAFLDLISERELKRGNVGQRQVRLEALRGIKKELLEARTAKGAPEEITDEATVAIMQKMVKQRKRVQRFMLHKNRSDLAEPELEQIKVIQQFLPAQLTDEELTAIIMEIIARQVLPP